MRLAPYTRTAIQMGVAVGAAIARKWIDEDHVDVIMDLPNSAVALAVLALATEKNKAVIGSGAGASVMTGPKCSKDFVHWTYDTYALANGTGKAVVKAGGDTWFFLTADYAFGHALQRDTSAVVEANGGKVLGSVNVPLNTPDFSSFLLQAQGSQAKIVGLANAGGDTTNSIKQAHEFGIAGGGQKLAALLLFISDVNAIGLDTAQGLQFTEAFYWDMIEATRAFSARFAQRMGGRMPTEDQAAAYSATLTAQYNAMDAAVAALKETQTYLNAEFNPNQSSSNSSSATSSLSSGNLGT